MLLFTALGLLGLVTTPVVSFWRLPCKDTLVVERADPIVSAGKVSGHVHQIMGGNGFKFQMSYDDTQASTCTSCTVRGDFSNYWTPVLYFQDRDGSFEKVDQIGGGLVYYLQRGGPNNDKLQAFPEGFRMVAGDPFKRSGGDDAASQGVSYNCLDYNGPAKPETGGFPNYDCPNGLRSQLFFPSCWDGKNLDFPDHKSHMSYPVGVYNSGSCPDTHPVHLVSIFYEIIWNTTKFADKWSGRLQPFVWSMGDPTGYGFHGDFINGWDVDLLQRAVDECTNDSGKVEDCPVFQLYPDSTAEQCKLAPQVSEDVQGPFNHLPGCNPIQNGPDTAQIVSSCVGNATSPLLVSQSLSQDSTASNLSLWTSLDSVGGLSSIQTTEGTTFPVASPSDTSSGARTADTLSTFSVPSHVQHSSTTTAIPSSSALSKRSHHLKIHAANVGKLHGQHGHRFEKSFGLPTPVASPA